MTIEQLSLLIKDLKGKPEAENVEMLSTAIETYMEKVNHSRRNSPPPRISYPERQESRVHTTPIKTEIRSRSSLIFFKCF